MNMTKKSICMLVMLLVFVAALTSCELFIELVPPSCEHTWVDATCTAPKTCSICNETEGAPLGHTEVTVPGKAATCTETGLTDGKKCSVCEETLVAQETIPAKGHTEVTVPGKAPTCTETGLTDGKKCSVCEETIVAQETIPAKGHTEVTVPGKAPTCTETGLTDGKKCYVCGETLVAQEDIPAKGHSYKTVVTAPNCTQSGYTTYTCDCGHSYIADEVAATGHSYDEGKITTAPSCETKGVKTFTCQTEGCGYSYTVDVDATGHSYTDTVVPATCITKGYTKHTCGNCGDSYTDNETALAEHTYEGVVTTKPTCDTEGVMTYTCSVEGCGDSYTESIPAAGHSEIPHEGQAATCTEDGWEAYVTCENCDYTTYKPVYATGHKGGKATCKELAVCTACGEKYGTVDLVNGHHYGEADCESPATCTLCGVTSGSAIGHLDENKDHVCDRAGCNEAMGVCEDKDFDHDCDYGCDKVFGECVDADKDHACDYGCDKVFGECVDADKDHACDYGCDKVFGAHADGDDKNHTCDYGCGEPVDGEACVDVNPKNHICDECGSNVGGECADSDDADHKCDYCDKKVEDCHGGEATCTKKAVCVECGNEYGSLIPHTYDQYNATEKALKNAATCTEAAQYYFSCSCGEVNRAEGADFFEYSDPLGHSYTATVTAPTCTAAGYTTYKCSGCGDTYNADEVAALGHDMITDNAVDPTCTETGLTEGSHCSRCDYKIEQQVVNALGHTEVTDAAVAPTCTEMGLTEGSHCSVCGEVFVAQTAIPMSHSYVDGVCVDCGISANIFSDKSFIPTEGAAANNIYSGNFGYGTLTDGIIYQEGSGRFSSKKNGGIVEATVNLEGIYALSELKIYLYKAGLSNLGTGLEIKIYSDDEWITVVNCATTEELQEHWFDNPDSDMDWLIFDLTDYSASKIMFTIPAQTSAGWTTLYEIECSGELTACLHTWVDATCSAPKTCSKCSATEGEPLPHTEVTDAAVAATCTSTGLTEGKHCSVCGTVLVKQEVVPMHNLVDGVCVDCGFINNILSGKEFVPTEEALASVLSASWWKGSGYAGLTDGIKNADNAPGRFSTVMATTGMMDATIDLGGAYELDSLRFYTYDSAGATNANTLGTSLLIQVYSNGEWVDVVSCADNASISNYLVVNEGVYDDYLKFDLNGIATQKIRFYISASVTGNGTTYEEIECSGKEAAHQHTWVDATCSAPKTCSECGATEGEPLPHTEVIDAAVAATCTSTGLTEGKHCSVCGTVLVKQEVVPMHNLVDGVCVDCGFINNILSGKEFVPTEEALASVLSASWWKGSGYAGLTDGIKNADNAPGRFSTVMATTGMMDATIDLGIAHNIESFRIYVYEVNESSATIMTNVGADLLIQVYANGEWTDVVTCADNAAICEHLVIVPGANNNYLEFDLNSVVAEKIRFYISASAASSGTTLQEIECSGKRVAHQHSWTEATCTAPKTCSECGDTEGEALGHNYVDGVCSRCGNTKVLIDNLLSGKTFTPTSDALASVLSASWWKGSGYEGLTDGIKNADNATGRFSTVMATTGMMDATIDLGAAYELHSMKFYIYEVTARTEDQIKGSIGTDILIQVYSKGEWVDVVSCTDNASLYAHLVSTEGTNNDYLEFDLGGITAEKVRFYISASASGSGTTYEEIECSGYEK